MRPETRQAITTASATVLSALAAIWLELENPWWAAFSAFVVSHADRHRLVLKGTMRLVATVVGAALGLELALASQGVMLLQGTAIFAAAFFITRRRLISPYAYAWLIGMKMIVMMMFISILEPVDLVGFAYARVLEVGLGVGLCTLINILVPGDPASPPAAAAPGAKTLLEINQVALLAAAVALSIPLLWTWLELPSMVQVGITTLAMIDRDVIRTRDRSGMRLLGCFSGGLLGLLLVGLQLNTLWVWAGALFFSLVLFGRTYHGEGRWAYFGTQGGLALIITLVTSAGPPDSILPVIERFVGILCGALLIVTASYVFAPKAKGAGEVAS